MEQMEQIDSLIDKFNLKMVSHPDISLMWINYLTIKKDRLYSMIQQAEHTIEMLETTDDIPAQTIALLYLIERYTNDVSNA